MTGGLASRARALGIAAVAVGALTFSLGTGGVAHADAPVTKSNDRFSYSGTTIAGCNGENISAEFTVHDVETLLIGDLRWTEQFHEDVQGKAQGDLGNTYVISGIANVTINGDNSGGQQLEFTVTNPLHNISKGPADNLQSRAVTHLTVNTNGEVTSEFTTIETTCIG